MKYSLKTNNNNLKTTPSFNVIFSDLECTLIGGGTKKLETWELYENECKKVSKIIDAIISLNNYFVIISSMHHDAKERISRKFNFFYNYVSSENRDKLLFFISEAEKEEGTIYHYEDINAGLISEKVECVDIVLDKLKSQGVEVKDIVGIGDDEKDVDMLFRIQELGGFVGTIAEKDMTLVNCFSFPEVNESNYEEIIKKIAEDEYGIDIQILVRIHQNEYCGGNFFKKLSSSEELQKIQEKKTIRCEELKKAYLSGEIDNNTLQRCSYVTQLANRYFTRYQYDQNNCVGYGEELIGRIYKVAENYSDKAISSNTNLLDIPIVKKLLNPSNNT